jgi:hypothetical protein
MLKKQRRPYDQRTRNSREQEDEEERRMNDEE